MAGQYQLPGGSLTVTEQDPLEVAKRRAELAILLQKPGDDRATLALQQWEANQRAQAAAGQLGVSTGQLDLDRQKLAATLPIEQGKLTVEQQRAAGEDRYHTGALNEDIRAHNAAAANEASRVKAGLVGDLITHVLPQEGVQGSGVAKGSTMAAISALGFPEISSNMAAAQRADLIKRASAFATQNKAVNEKQFGAITAGLPPGTDPEYVNAAWNQYKVLHPEVYGKDVTDAASTALQPPAPPTVAAPTVGSALTNAYVATGAGSPDVGWAMGPDSPRASATPGLSQFGPLKPQMGIVDPNNPSEVLPLPGRETKPVAPPPAPTDQLVKTAAAPQVAPVVAGAPPATPALPPPINPNVRPPTVNVDQLLSSFVGNPTMEDLERRKRSALAATLTPFRTNQY